MKKNKNMRLYIVMRKVILSLMFLFSFVTFTYGAVNYEMLAPLPDVAGSAQTSVKIDDNYLQTYFRTLYRMGIALATGLAVLMIIMGGIEYITTDAIGGKEEGKERISNAIMGLLLALSSFVILRTIDPNLVNVSLDIKSVDPRAFNYLLSKEAAFYFDMKEIGPTTSANRTGPNNDVDGYVDPNDPLLNSKFKNAEWNDEVLRLVEKYGLTNLNPRDATAFFPDGDARNPQNWANLIAGITAKESGFDPTLTYPERNKDGSPRLNNDGQQIISTGLMQLSYESSRGYGFTGITTTDLKNPQKNLEVGVKILSELIGKDGVISGGTSEETYIGGAKYWSTLRIKK